MGTGKRSVETSDIEWLGDAWGDGLLPNKEMTEQILITCSFVAVVAPNLKLNRKMFRILIIGV